MNKNTYKLRKADITDINKIKDLVNPFAENNEMLPRTVFDIIASLRDFVVVINNDEIIGCGALNITWIDIAEIRSLAIKKEYQRKGIGSYIVKYLLKEAKQLKIKKVFALTYKPDFFKTFGFKFIDKEKLPKKVWTDCIKCPKFPDCDEIAVILDL
jgi:amino-acid N-acetyltransferase